jgi:hypothetical protein
MSLLTVGREGEGETSTTASRVIHTRRAASRSSIFMILTVLAFATIPVAPYLFDNLWGPDESMLLVYPQRILSGQWPNRDFFNNAYGPGQFWLLAGAYRIFGASVITERLIGWLLHIAIALGVVRITRFRGRFVAGTAGCASAFILAFLNLSAFAWLGALSLAIWSIGIMVGRTTRGTSLVAGVLVAMVFAIRPDLGPAAIICQVPLLWRSQFKFSWLLGFGLGAVPMVIHLTVAGAEFVKNFLFVIRESSTGIAVPPNVPITLRVLELLLVASVLALVWTIVRERDPGLLAVTLLSILLLPQAFQRTDLTHIADAGCFIWPMWFAIVFSRSRLARGVVHRYGVRWLRICFSVAAVVLMGATLTMEVSSWRATFWLNHLDKSVPLREATALQEDKALILAINQRVPPGGRIFVGAVDMNVLNYSPMYLYFLLPEYRPAGYYLELPGGFDGVGKMLATDIRGADALILSDMPDLQHDLYRSGFSGAFDVNEIVRENFCPAGRYGANLLYIRCQT